jgi:hypothetical protein
MTSVETFGYGSTIGLEAIVSDLLHRFEAVKFTVAVQSLNNYLDSVEEVGRLVDSDADGSRPSVHVGERWRKG